MPLKLLCSNAGIIKIASSPLNPIMPRLHCAASCSALSCSLNWGGPDTYGIAFSPLIQCLEYYGIIKLGTKPKRDLNVLIQSSPLIYINVSLQTWLTNWQKMGDLVLL